MKKLFAAVASFALLPVLLVTGLVIALSGSMGDGPSQCDQPTSSSGGGEISGAVGGTLPVSGPDWAQQINMEFPGYVGAGTLATGSGPIDTGNQAPNSPYAADAPLQPGGQSVRLSGDVIAALAESAGRTVGVNVPGATMAQVARGESGWLPGAVQNTSSEHHRGFGLWQITDPYGKGYLDLFGWKYQTDMLNPVKSAIAMALKYKQEGRAAWYGTAFVTDWNSHYSGDLPLVNLYEVLGIPGPGGGAGTSSHFVSDTPTPGGCGDDTSGFAGPADFSEAERVSTPGHWVDLPEWATAPGYTSPAIHGGRARIDSRIADNILWMLSNYNLRVHDCLASGHNTHGGGNSCDLVPTSDPFPIPGRWENGWNNVTQLAKDLGWKPPGPGYAGGYACNSGAPFAPAIRIICYNGDTNHGDPLHFTNGGCGCPHLHISFQSAIPTAGVELPQPAPWIMRFVQHSSSETPTRAKRRSRNARPS